MNVFVFDIETIPDVDSGRQLFGIDPQEMARLSDKEVARVMEYHRFQETGSQTDILRHHLQKVVAIAAVFRHGDTFKVWSLGDEHASEAELIQRFFDGIQRYTPTLVSWNGGGFDLPVLHYRAMLHKITAPRYWETHGEFRYNNYTNRYHERHLDLMDVLSNFQMRACAKLDEIATMLGFPGKMGMSGDKVWDTYLAGELDKIRQYCETDTLNTYLVFLRFELMRGHLNLAEYEQECELVRSTLAADNKAHLNEFLAAWPSTKG